MFGKNSNKFLQITYQQSRILSIFVFMVLKKHRKIGSTTSFNAAQAAQPLYFLPITRSRLYATIPND